MRQRTLADQVEELGGKAALREAAHPLARRVVDVPAEAAGVVHFRCRCGRVVTADMMRDFDDPAVPPGQRLTAEERERLGLGADRFRCDADWTGWLWKGLITRERLREATGQPPPAEGRAW